MINQKQLLSVGFSDKQAKVYLALLELGPSTVSEIARMASINRTTGYDILEMLVSEGLASPVGKDKVQKYVAENPETLLGFVEHKIKAAQESRNEVKKMIPELQSLYKTKAKPTVRFFEGKEGVKRVFEDTLTAKSELVGYASAEPMYKSIPGFFPDYVKRRIAKKIHCRMVAPDTPESKKVASTDKQQLRKSRLVPQESLDLEIEVNIYDNKVMIVSWAENLGILIESEKIAKAQKQIFELAWRGARKK